MVILLFLANLTFVSAVNLNETEDIVDIYDSENVLADVNSTETYNSLQLLIDSQDSHVSLEHDYMYDWGSEPENMRYIYYTSGITISDKHDFEIDGQGHFISGNPNNAGGDAKYGAKLLTVSSSCSNITLKNIVFKDVRYGGSNALTFSCDRITLKNCTFENIAIDNVAVSFSDEAIIEECTFVNDTSFSRDLIYFSGYSSLSRIQNSIFNNNSAEISSIIFFNGDAVVENSIFTNNKNRFGTIVNKKESIISNSTFSGNANRAIYSNGILNIECCNFTENGLSDVQGGVIYSSGGNTRIINSIFNNNAGSGSIIECLNYLLDLKGCAFSSNDVGDGSTIIFDYGNIENCTFIKNKARLGSIYTQKNANITNSVFTGNSNRAIFFNGTTNVDSCNFTDNGNVDGAALFGYGYLKVSNSIFNHNVGVECGAIYSSGEIEVSNSSFNFNSGNFNGIIYVTKGVVDGCTFSNNNGRSIYIKDDGNVTNCVFTDNQGQSITAYGSAVIDGCNFTDNVYAGSTQWGGAAIFGSNANLTVSNSIFRNNTGPNGGAIYSYGRNNRALVENCIFESNSGRTGSAISLENSKLIIRSSTFINNDKQGHVIYLSGTGGEIYDCIFLNNSNNNVHIYSSPSLEIGNNWYGNNASNYDVNIAKIEGKSIENWYFLDATVFYDYTEIFLNNLYNSSNNEITTIKDCELPVLNLTLAGENLTIQDTAVLKNGVSVIPSVQHNKYVSLTVNLLNHSFTKDMRIPFGEFGILQKIIDDAGPDCVIELNKNYTYTVGFDEGSDGISINHDNVIINGNGFTIDAKSLSSIFTVNANNVSINDISFINSQTAINWVGDYGQVDNSSFANSFSSKSGGMINWMGDYGSIYNSTFENGTADYNGGAISISGDYFRVIDCSFINNFAKGDGGSIYWSGINGIVSGCDFLFNHVDSFGGAISWFGENGFVNNSSFVKNSASAIAGAIYLYGHRISVNNSSFINNSAGMDAGALYCDGNGDIINGSEFVDNFAQNGGAIYCGGSDGVINDSTFLRNKAKSGGAIFWISANGIVNESHFIKNSATLQYGGAIYLNCVNGIIADCDFADNDAADSGGSIFWRGEDGSCINSQFVNNTAKNYAGAIQVDGNDMTVFGCDFLKNHAILGAAIYWTGSNGLVSASHFENHSVVTEGGAIYWQGVDGVVNSSIFMNNSAASYGGAVYWNSSNGLINDSEFIQNIANDGGGAVFWNGPNGSVNSSSFINNSVQIYGGAIRWKGYGGVINASNFQNNFAKIYGGAIFLFGEANKVNGCNLSNNVANSGGAICVQSVRSAVNSSNFVNNSVSTYGGAISWFGDYGLINCSTFADNSAMSDGGAINLQGSNSVVESSSFTNNSAGGIGGAISWFADYGFVNATYFADNSARAGAGALYIRSDHTTISYSSFKGNIANNYRHIFKQGDNFKIENSTFETIVLLNEIPDGPVHSNITIDATFDDGTNYDGYLVALLNGSEKIKTFSPNLRYSYQYSMYNLLAGSYLITIGAINDDGNIYDSSYSPIKFMIYKYNSTVTVYPISDVVYNDDVAVNFEIKNETVALFDIKDIKNHIVRMGIIDSDGLVIDDLDPGNYTFTISNRETETYLGSSDSAKFTVYESKNNTDVSVDVVSVENNVTITVDVCESATGLVELKIGETVIYLPIDGGKAKYDAVLAKGNYTVVATYLGDDKFNPNSTSKTFNVNGHVVENTTFEVDYVINGTDVTLIIASNADGEIDVFVDANQTAVKLENGSAELTVQSLDYGTHSVVIVYSGDYNHKEATYTTSIRLEDFGTRFTNITVADGRLTAALIFSTGKGLANVPIIVTIDGTVVYMTTDSNGIVEVGNVSGKIIELSFAGNGTILPSNIVIGLTSESHVKSSTTLLAKDFTQYACDYYEGERGGFFKFRLVDSKDKPLENKTVFIGYNGVTYNRTTDEDGYASLQINLKNAGIYTFVIVFLNDENYNATMAVHKITINKKTTSIFASAKTFKATAKTKKYTVTLKTIKGASVDGKTYLAKGKKVTLKINGKTYTAKTNAKGQATFSLKITKKGKFATVIKFAGDNTYDASSKKVKITIK